MAEEPKVKCEPEVKGEPEVKEEPVLQWEEPEIPGDNYTEQEEPKDDHYLYCEECESFFIEECELHGPPLFIADTPVALGVSERATLTLPHGLEVKRSQIPGAALGVFNCGQAVAKGTYYGPYEGEVMDKEDAVDSGYTWVIRKSKYIDAKRETHSNWMRYVNCARTEEEQNLVAFQYHGGILYRCCRLLAIGEELLVWYGQEYRYKSISFHYFWDQKSTARGVSELSQTQVFSCSECPFSYTSQFYLHEHIKRSHDNLYIALLRNGEIRSETLSSCRLLPITSSNSLLSTAPAWRQRDTDKPRPYHCDYCGKNFRTAGNLRIHQRIHTEEKPYHCDQCGRNFSVEATLRTHQRIHTGEKPYHCDQCGKNFIQSGALKKHQRVHTGEKPYHCDQCGKNFRTKGNLRSHQSIHTGEKPYHCDQCGRNFNVEANLMTHQRIHTGEKPYHCDQCGKNFIQSGYLKIHQRVHTGEKPYHCDQCGKNFSKASNLRTHQRIHTGEKPYHCDQCGKNFSQSISLKKHQRVHTVNQKCSQSSPKPVNKDPVFVHHHLEKNE